MFSTITAHFSLSHPITYKVTSRVWNPKGKSKPKSFELLIEPAVTGSAVIKLDGNRLLFNVGNNFLCSEV